MIYMSLTHILTAFFPQCLAQFSTFMKSATDVFTQKNFPKDIFNSKICYSNFKLQVSNFKSALHLALV